MFYSLSASGIQRVLSSKPIDQTNKLSEVDSTKILGSTSVLFGLAEDGKRSLVNYKWDNRNLRFIVDQVLERAILVLGDKNVVVSKT